MISRFTKIVTFFVTITQGVTAFSQSVQQDVINTTQNKFEKVSLSGLPSIRLWEWWFKQKEVRRSLMVQPQKDVESAKEIIAYNPLSTLKPSVSESTTQARQAENSKTVVLMNDAVIKEDVDPYATSINIVEAKEIEDIKNKNVTVDKEPVKMVQFLGTNTTDVVKLQESVVIKKVESPKTRVIYEAVNLLPDESVLQKRIVINSGDKLSKILRDFLTNNDFELSWQVENGNGKARDYQLLERAVFIGSDLSQVLEKVVEPFGLYAKIYEQEKMIVISSENNTTSVKTTSN